MHQHHMVFRSTGVELENNSENKKDRMKKERECDLCLNFFYELIDLKMILFLLLIIGILFMVLIIVVQQ